MVAHRFHPAPSEAQAERMIVAAVGNRRAWTARRRVGDNAEGRGRWFQLVPPPLTAFSRMRLRRAAAPPVGALVTTRRAEAAGSSSFRHPSPHSHECAYGGKPPPRRRVGDNAEGRGRMQWDLRQAAATTVRRTSRLRFAGAIPYRNFGMADAIRRHAGIPPTPTPHPAGDQWARPAVTPYPAFRTLIPPLLRPWERSRAVGIRSDRWDPRVRPWGRREGPGFP